VLSLGNAVALQAIEAHQLQRCPAPAAPTIHPLKVHQIDSLTVAHSRLSVPGGTMLMHHGLISLVGAGQRQLDTVSTAMTCRSSLRSDPDVSRAHFPCWCWTAPARHRIHSDDLPVIPCTKPRVSKANRGYRRGYNFAICYGICGILPGRTPAIGILFTRSKSKSASFVPNRKPMKHA